MGMYLLCTQYISSPWIFPGVQCPGLDPGFFISSYMLNKQHAKALRFFNGHVFILIIVYLKKYIN
jgi:hypothetical protein